MVHEIARTSGVRNETSTQRGRWGALTIGFAPAVFAMAMASTATAPTAHAAGVEAAQATTDILTAMSKDVQLTSLLVTATSTLL